MSKKTSKESFLDQTLLDVTDEDLQKYYSDFQDFMDVSKIYGKNNTDDLALLKL